MFVIALQPFLALRLLSLLCNNLRVICAKTQSCDACSVECRDDGNTFSILGTFVPLWVGSLAVCRLSEDEDKNGDRLTQLH